MSHLRIYLALFMIVILNVSSYATENEFKKILGLWEFSAPSAPQPYNQGVLILKDVDQKLAGSFKMEGQELLIPKIDFTSDTLKMEFEVESTPISLKMILKNGVLHGTTDTPNGLVEVTAKPSAK